MEDEGHLIQERKRKLHELKEKGINPYAARYPKTHYAIDLLKKHDKLKKEAKTKDDVKIAGRLISLRRMGKVTFAHLMDGTGKIQLYLREDLVGKEQYDLLKKLDVGDIIGAEGTIFRTKMGELTVEVKTYQLLTKSLLPFPEKFHGLQDQELRYRQRYLDLIMNPEVKDVFDKRSKILQAIREFMDKQGFTEVETPILQPNYGGASARPFESHLNVLKMKVYMRISDELFLKRLIVGGYEKVYEFSKDFRNEGVDKLHNPEFLQVETMWAYADYKDNMKFCEEYVSFIAKKVLGTTKITYQGKTIDLKAPWKKIRLYDLLKEKLGIDFEKIKTKEEAEKIAQKLWVKTERCYTKGHVIAEIFEELIQPTLIQPTIVYDYPADLFGLAKKDPNNPEIAQAFEPIVNGWELGLSYCEQNDPEVLKAYWKKEEELGRCGDEEAQRTDDDFLNALSYGMPPVSGLGIGIDRLAMLLTDSVSIRDVIFFPFMKHEN